MHVSRVAGATVPVQGPERSTFKEVLDRTDARARLAPPSVIPKAPLGGAVQAFTQRVADAQRQLDSVLEQARAGRTFSPAELLGLQVRVGTASQVVDFAGKAVDKAVGGIKQVLQTSV